MKLATLRNGRRDGRVVLVDRDLRTALAVTEIGSTLQELLDHWAEVAPSLEQRYQALNRGAIAGAEPFDPAHAAAPLPRAYQWCDGSAYLSHAELVRKARNAEMPDFLYKDPLMYQGASDTFLGAHDDIEVEDEAFGIDLEAEIAVITDDVPMGVRREEAGAYIKLVTIVNDVSLRNLIPNELAKGFGFLHSKPSTAFAPVAVTPDELVPYWDGAKLGLPLVSRVNGRELGRPNAGVDLDFDFPTLIAHAARTRRLIAGTVVGSGTVSNRDLGVGSSCLQERRMIEKIDTGEMKTPFLAFGDRVEIEMTDPQGCSLFGRIDQRVVRYVRKD
jgi:fumarylacetoacetate (FAA) hydrolase